MKLENMIHLIKSWADTRNDSIYAILESELIDLYERAGHEEEMFSESNFSENFKKQIKMVYENRQKKLGTEGIIVSSYNEKFNTMEIFESMGEAAKLLDGNQGKISNCIKDGTKHKERIWTKILK